MCAHKGAMDGQAQSCSGGVGGGLHSVLVLATTNLLTSPVVGCAVLFVRKHAVCEGVALIALLARVASPAVAAGQLSFLFFVFRWEHFVVSVGDRVFGTPLCDAGEVSPRRRNACLVGSPRVTVVRMYSAISYGQSHLHANKKAASGRALVLARRVRHGREAGAVIV